MTKREKTAGAPKRQLSLLDTTCIIVGIIIGSGIYKTTPIIAGNVPNAATLLLVWIAGGLISLVGALCYAELATAFPREGGDYVYLTQAYGRRVGFVFAWSEFWILRPGNVGMMGFVFAEYAKSLYALNLGEQGQRYDELVYAAAAVTVLTALNLLGVRSGKWTQNLLTGVKIIGLLVIFAVALFWSPEAGASPPQVQAAPINYSLPTAMVLVLFTYGGWNDVSFVAAEVREPRKNLLRALLLGLAIVTVIYVLVNLAFLHVLGLDGTAASPVPAADVVQRTLGAAGSRFMSALVCVSALGAMNGMTFTGARIYYAVGEEHRLYSWLGRWNARFDTPLRALSIQFAVTLALVLLIGRRADGFETLLMYTTPVFWAFIFLVGVALFILRYEQADTGQVFRVPLFPVTPIVFCASVAFLWYSSLDYAIKHHNTESLWALAIVGLGVVMSFFDPKRNK
jgi:APA family basic amino acid/polyamine antiporter